MQSISESSLSAVLAIEDITALFYCTAARFAGSSSGSSSPSVQVDEIGDDMLAKEMQLPKPTSAEVHAPVIRRGRPDIPALIKKAAACAKESESCLGIMVCGPAELADEARNSAWRCMDQYSNSVQYFEEAFGW